MQRLLLFLFASSMAQALELHMLVPSSAPQTGGKIKITGFGIAPADTFEISLQAYGGADVSRTVVDNSISNGNLVFETGVLDPGYYLVSTVRQRGGQSQSSTNSLWIYGPPTLVSAEPSTVATLGGEDVVIRGSGLIGPSE